MITVTVFGKKDCDACKAAIEKVSYFTKKWGWEARTRVQFIDMDTPDGLAEGAYRDVFDIPTVILEKNNEELARWVKQVPASRDFRIYFERYESNEKHRDKGLH